MMQVGTSQSTTYHSQPSLSTTGGQTGRSSSTSRQQPSPHDSEQLANIRPRLCTLRKWPHYDGYGVHLARNQHWLGLRIGDVEPNSPAESGGLLREDVVLAVNGHSVENDDFFVILSFIQHELEDDQIRFLVLDPHSADLARRYHLNIDENYRTCVRMETPVLTVSPEKLLYDQWRGTNSVDPAVPQNTIRLGPTLSSKSNQMNTNSLQQQERTSGRREDVYTFLPYSDHAIENGKSVFEILFDKNDDPSTTYLHHHHHQQQQQQQQQGSPKAEQPWSSTPSTFIQRDDVGHETEKNQDDKMSGNITADVKNLVKSGLESFKSILPTKNRDDKDSNDSSDNKSKSSSEPTDITSKPDESPKLLDKLKKKLKMSSNTSISTDSNGQDLQMEDPTPISKAEPRICSIVLRPGIDTIGIAIQPDKDFGHLIKQVEKNSLADRAGIQQDDCIISLNDAPLLNIPYDDVLTVLKRSRNESNLDFVVAKKSYLLETSKNKLTTDKYKDKVGPTTAEVMASSNISSNISPAEALEQLYNKYNDEPKNFDRSRETSSTIPSTINQPYDSLTPPLDNNRYPSKQQYQGQILQGVGPAVADRSSWGVSSEKSIEDYPPPISGTSSIRSTSNGQKLDGDDSKRRVESVEDAFKPLQVGITNPTQSQRSGNVSPVASTGGNIEDGKRASRPTSIIEQQDVSPKSVQSLETTTSKARDNVQSSPPSRQNQTIQNITSVVPVQQVSSSKQNDEQGSTQVTPQNAVLGPASQKIAPIKPIPVKQAMPHFDDSDDDELSDISEKSREEDISESNSQRNSQANIVASNQMKVDAPYSDVSKASAFGTSQFSTKDDLLDNPKLDVKQELTSNIPDAGMNATVSSSTGKQVVQAHRLEYSDSEDTTSGADSYSGKPSSADKYYSPDESVEGEVDTDDETQNRLDDKHQTVISQTKSSENGKDQSIAKATGTIESHTKSDDTADENDDDDNDDDTESNTSDKTPIPTDKMALARIPLSQLKEQGYELHNIQLMQPTETSPVGLKLTKQQDPLQYIITAVAPGTKADLAGLKVNDWLVKIEDNDIRLLEFSEVSQDIRQLLTNAGLINMVVARKTSGTSSPSTKQIEKQTASAPTRSESFNRQQGQASATLFTTDITRDTPDSSQVRFTPIPSKSPPASRSQSSPVSNRDGKSFIHPNGFSVGLTNPPSEENLARSPRSQSRSPSRSPTREYTIAQKKSPILDKKQKPETSEQQEVRHIVLKEAVGLDFNSFIPEDDNKTQTHFISNVQPQSIAGKAGLRDGDRILTVNGVDVMNSVHEDVRAMMQKSQPLQLTVVNDPEYLELIERIKTNANKLEGTADKVDSFPPAYETLALQKSSSSSDVNDRPAQTTTYAGSESGSTSNIPYSKSDSPKQTNKDTLPRTYVLFTDDNGPVHVKNCLLKKDPSYSGYGLLLRYQNGLHLIDQVEENSPAFNAGIREGDVMLYVDNKNVEEMTHDDVKILIRKLSLANTNIDLILIRKTDVQRYRTYQAKNTVDWKSILQVEEQKSNVIRSLNEQTNGSSKSSLSSSGKQQAPAPPTSSKIQSMTSSDTRTCILQPTADHTAGFALSGKSPPPYIICQIEANSPAEKSGLHLNDALLSVNGKSVTTTTYEETVKIIKEALQQNSIELVVRNPPTTQSNDDRQGQSQGNFPMTTSSKNSVGNNENIGELEPSQRGANAVEEYQKQRNKELSYALRVCHLHPSNGDGTQASTFGFELSDEADYEYPLILRVQPQSPAETAGLQSRDILLKVNERKTKGLGYDKVKKEIEKAKLDGRLEMLVADQETFDYCQRAKKQFKEPDIKVKHIFPKSRSSASFHKLPIAPSGRRSSNSSKDSIEQLSGSTSKDEESLPVHHNKTPDFHLSMSKETDSENEELREETLAATNYVKSVRSSQPAVSFDLSASNNTNASASARSHESSLKFIESARSGSQQIASPSSEDSKHSSESRISSSVTQTPSKESKGSKSKSIPNAINNLFHKIGHSKSSKHVEGPSKSVNRSKPRAPSPPTVRIGHNRLDVPRVSQSLGTVAVNGSSEPLTPFHDTVRSTVSTGSFDYLRGPRRCVLKVDRNKGLGFVLSATGDYDHTITAVEKYSAADIAGLQVNDELLEVDGVDVRNVTYEQVVQMLLSAMQANDSIEMRVIDGRSRDVYTSTVDGDKQTDSNDLLNSNNNNNSAAINATTKTINTNLQNTNGVLNDDISDINSSISPFDSLNQQKIATSYPNLSGQLKQFDYPNNRSLSGSVPALATGITASPSAIHPAQSISMSSEKGSLTKLSDISTQEAPVARLCRIRKFANSPFYGFFLCGDPKKLGRAFISDVTKHSPAAVCGLRDGDRIVEINGTSIELLTYETILDKIKQHMALDDLELLVLDKKSLHWYRERNYPITSRTLPTIVHIEPIINDTHTETHFSEVPATHTKLVGFADRRVSKTGL